MLGLVTSEFIVMTIIEEVNKKIEELSQAYQGADTNQQGVISQQINLLKYVSSYYQQRIIGDETANNLLRLIKEQEFNRVNQLLTEAYNSYMRDQEHLSKSELIQLQKKVASSVGKEVKTGKEIEIPGLNKFCPYCGKKISADAKVCSYCGKKL